jgi:hypothetical protein
MHHHQQSARDNPNLPIPLQKRAPQREEQENRKQQIHARDRKLNRRMGPRQVHKDEKHAQQPSKDQQRTGSAQNGDLLARSRSL